MNIRLILGLSLIIAFGMTGFVSAQDEMSKDDAAAKHAAPIAKPATPQLPSTPDATLPPSGSMVDQPIAMLQALDKITARIRRIPVKVGQSVVFGTLSIAVDVCRKAPPEDSPESAAFIKITDAQHGIAPQVIFSGWMFASSPALSAMEHPVYDIWVVDCTSEATVSAAPASAN